MSRLSVERWENGFCQHWRLWLFGFPWFIKTFSPASMWLKLSLTYISLMISDIEHLQIHIGHLYVFGKNVYQLSIFHWIFFLLLLNYINSFYILDINSLLNICFANVFSHFIDCLFILLFPLLYRGKIDVVSLVHLFFITSQLRWPLPKSQN